MDTPQNTLAQGKKWIIDTGEGVWEADSETLSQWIMEGAVLPHHRISREGVRWLEARKVPQFALLFIGQTEVVQAPVPPVDDGPPVRDESVETAPQHDEYEPYDSFRPPPPPSFALRFAASSFLMLLIAAVISYVWAFHLSSKRAVSAMEKEPLLVELIERQEKEKMNAMMMGSPDKMLAIATMPALIKEKTGSLGPRKTGGKITGEQLRLPGAPDMPEFYQAAPNAPVSSQTVAASADPAQEQKLKQLEDKFEAEREKAIDAITGQDSKSRFLSTVIVLFVLFAGLNLGRMKLYGKKDR